MATLKDVPSVIPFEEIPFEKWRPFLEEPFLDRNLVLVTLDGDAMVGLLNLGKLRGSRINIDHTSVARDYRRRGISTALKCAAIRLGRNIGATEITTQSHQHNPIFTLNQSFGSGYTDPRIDGFKEL